MLVVFLLVAQAGVLLNVCWNFCYCEECWKWSSNACFSKTHRATSCVVMSPLVATLTTNTPDTSTWLFSHWSTSWCLISRGVVRMHFSPVVGFKPLALEDGHAALPVLSTHPALISPIRGKWLETKLRNLPWFINAPKRGVKLYNKMLYDMNCINTTKVP